MHRTTIATLQVQVAPVIASYMHCACEPVTVHGCTRVFMIVPHLSTHAVVSCVVKTMSCNTTPQAEGAKFKRRVINANCVKCAHLHRERPQKHDQRCIWKQRALTSGRTNLGGKHKKYTSQNIGWTVFPAHFSLARSCNMRERAVHHSNCTMFL